MKGNTNFLLKGIILNTARSKRENDYFMNNSYKNIYLETKDNVKIGAAVYEPFKITKDTKYIILCHGSGCNRDDFSEIGESQCFSKDGYVMLVIDYRGFGDSEGEFVRDKINLDLLSCFDYLIENYNPEHISLIGHSLGTGIVGEYLKYIEICKRYHLYSDGSSVSDENMLDLFKEHEDNILYLDKYDERYMPSNVFLISPFSNLKILLDEFLTFSVLRRIFPSFSRTAEELLYDNLTNLKFYSSDKIFIYHGRYDRIISYKHSVNLKEGIGCYLKIFESDHIRILLSDLLWEDIRRIMITDKT